MKKHLILFLIISVFSMNVFAGTIVVNTTGNVNEINAGAISVTNATTGAPEVSSTNTSTGAATINTNITTLSNNAWVIDVVGSGNGGNYNPGAGQTERWDVQGGSATGASSTKLVAAAALTTMSQTHSTTSNRTAHAVISIAPSGGAITFDAASSNSALNVNTTNWVHAGAGIGTKLIVGIAVENGTCSGNEVLTGVTHDGADLTFAAAITVDTGFCQRVEIWYQDVLPQTPVADWYMDGPTWVGAANEVVDSSGNNNHGTSFGGISPVTGKVCNAADLSANSIADYVSMNNNALNGLTDFTASFWVNTTNGGNQAALSGATAGQANEFLAWFPNSTTFQPFIKGANLGGIAIPNIADGNWHHVAWTRSGANNCVAINGTNAGCVGGGSVVALNIDAGGLIIGQEQDNVGGGFDINQDWQGEIDEVIIFPTNLSNAQILSVYNNQDAGNNWDGTARVCPAIAPLAYYQMDETTWLGANSVIDISGNANHGTPLGAAAPEIPASAPALAGNPGSCGYGDIPLNNNNAISAVDTNFTPGNRGSITFWYKSNENWTGPGTGDRLLFDASRNLGGGPGGENADKHFFMVRRNNNGGALRFLIEDTADTRLRAQVTGLGIAANQWRHIAVTWDLPNDFMEIYINGVSVATDNTNTNGNIGNINDLYIGDNRGGGTAGNGFSNDSTNGNIDEFKIYDQVISSTQVNTDFNSTHPCPSTGPDHYAISYPNGTPGVTCEALAVRITAHGDAIDHSIIVAPSSSTTITLSTIPMADGWTLKSGDGTFIPPNQYEFDGLETFAEFWLTETTATLSIDIDVTDGTATDIDGDLTEDADINFVDAAFRFFAGGTADAIGTQIAGKESNILPGSQTIQLRSVVTNTATMACETRILNSQSIEFGFECDNPTTCQVVSRVEIDDTTDITPGNDQTTIGIASGDYNPVTLDFGLTGIAGFTFDYDEAGRIRLHARKVIAASDPEPAYTLYGTSNYFVVRPFGFATAIVSNIGGDPNTGANTPAGDLFTTAGTDFRALSAAFVWDANDDDGTDCDLVSEPACLADDGRPDTNANLLDNAVGVVNFITQNFQGTGAANVTLSAVAPYKPDEAGSTLGALLDSGSGFAPVFSAVSYTNGISSVLTTINYLEVGSITLGLQTVNYLGSGENIFGRSSNLSINPNNGVVGRFGADNFTFVVDTAPVLEPACGTFTYVDQSFDFTATPEVTARAMAADGTTILNNYGDFSGAGGSNWWLLPFDSGVTMTYTDLALPTDINFDSITADYSPNIGTTGIGGTQQFDFSGPFSYAKNMGVITEQAPFNGSIQLDFTVMDSDGATGTQTFNPITFSDPQQRWGRLSIGTAFGSELLPLSVPIRTEYFNGTGFIPNVDDACTALNQADHIRLDNTGAVQNGAANVVIGGGTSNISTFNTPVILGDTATEFSAPGAGNTGFVDITGNLDCLEPTIACVGATTFDYLLYDWNEDGIFSENPSGRIDFGVYGGSSHYIYIREPW